MKTGPAVGVATEEEISLAREVEDFKKVYKGNVEAREDNAAWSSDSEISNEGGDDSGQQGEARRKAAARARRDKRRRSYLYGKTWERFRACFRCNIWRAGANIFQPLAPIPLRIDVWEKEAVTVIIDLVLRTLPPRASKGKWLKFGPANDWHTLATGLGILQQLWSIAYSSIRLRVDTPDTDLDPALYQEFNWHKLESKRCKYMHRNMTPSRTAACVITSVVFEPLKYLGAWWMRRASAIRCLAT